MATHSTGDTKCPECGKKFSRIASFKAHMMIHQKEDNLFCTECEDLFATKVSNKIPLQSFKKKKNPIVKLISGIIASQDVI